MSSRLAKLLPVAEALATLDRRATRDIVAALAQRPYKFSELLVETSVSSADLTVTLRGLERHDFVRGRDGRHELTERGRGLVAILGLLPGR